MLDKSVGIGLVYSHVLNDRTYYELTVNGMRTKLTEGVDVIDPDRFRDDITDGSVWERPIGRMDSEPESWMMIFSMNNSWT